MVSQEWTALTSSQIAESARDLLIDVLHPSAAYVQLHGRTVHEPFRSAAGMSRPGLHFAETSIGPDGALGRLAAGSSRPDFPDEFERLVLETVAGQVGIALRHTHPHRLPGLARRRRRSLRPAAVAALGTQALAEGFSDRLLDESLSWIRRCLRVNLAAILELAESRSTVLLRAGAGWDPEASLAEMPAGPDNILGHALRSCQPVTVDLQDPGAAPPIPELLAQRGVTSCMHAAIQARQGPYGLLGAYSMEPRVFSADEQHFLQSVANVLGAAVQRHAREVELDELLVQTRRAVGIVSHDLGNPLTTIQICANALLDDDPPPLDGVRHMAQLIQRSVSWMRQMVVDLLDRTSLDAGLLMLKRSATAVSDVIGAAQTMFAPVARESEVELVVVADPVLPPVDADRRRLLQVLSNLLGNAIKFTPTGGRVELSATRDPKEGAVRFQVSDTGRGIPADHLGHIFDWYWHSDESGRRPGTGLGLAIAYGIVEAHGSRLHVESVPDLGSTFWFTLPAAGQD